MSVRWKNVIYEEYDLRCNSCYTKLPYAKRWNTFCDRTCAASFTNKHRVLSTRVKQFTNWCIRCNKGIGPKLNRCGECRKRDAFNFDTAKTSWKRRRILIARRGHRCERCNLSEWNEAPIPLDMDHINGNSDVNTEENLRLLCPNCHAQTPTYKSKNRGVGASRQLLRMQKYRENLLV